MQHRYVDIYFITNALCSVLYQYQFKTARTKFTTLQTILLRFKERTPVALTLTLQCFQLFSSGRGRPRFLMASCIVVFVYVITIGRIEITNFNYYTGLYHFTSRCGSIQNYTKLGLFTKLIFLIFSSKVTSERQKSAQNLSFGLFGYFLLF